MKIKLCWLPKEFFRRPALPLFCMRMIGIGYLRLWRLRIEW